MCCGITWESIAESLREDKLPSMLYKELPHNAYFIHLGGTYQVPQKPTSSLLEGNWWIRWNVGVLHSS
jgi:hypothetical protein